MMRRPPGSTRTDTRFPYTTLFRSLVNDDIALADAALTVPLNPAFASLNLAQAVLLVGHAWFLAGDATPPTQLETRSEEHTSELQSLMRISYAVFCLKKKTQPNALTVNQDTSSNHTLTTSVYV